MARIKAPKSTELSFTQTVILNLLEKHSGKVLAPRAIARRIWKGKLPASWASMLATEIHGLRKNLPNKRWQIVNVHSRGYMLGCEVVHSA